MSDHKPSVFTEHERFIESLRNAVFASKRSYHDIALDCKISASTVGNLASGKTRWPRYTTLFPLARTLGKRVALVDD